MVVVDSGSGCGLRCAHDGGGAHEQVALEQPVPCQVVGWLVGLRGLPCLLLSQACVAGVDAVRLDHGAAQAAGDVGEPLLLLIHHGRHRIGNVSGRTGFRRVPRSATFSSFARRSCNRPRTKRVA